MVSIFRASRWTSFGAIKLSFILALTFQTLCCSLEQCMASGQHLSLSLASSAVQEQCTMKKSAFIEWVDADSSLASLQSFDSLHWVKLMRAHVPGNISKNAHCASIKYHTTQNLNKLTIIDYMFSMNTVLINTFERACTGLSSRCEKRASVARCSTKFITTMMRNGGLAVLP